MRNLLKKCGIALGAIALAGSLLASTKPVHAAHLAPPSTVSAEIIPPNLPYWWQEIGESAAKGAVSGAVGGAVSGAVSCGAAGAAAGAAVGAVGGALAGAVTEALFGEVKAALVVSHSTNHALD